MSSPLADSFNGLGGDSPPTAADDDFPVESSIFSAAPYPPPICVSGGGFSADPAEFSPELEGEPFEGGHVADNGPILPPPVEMGRDEGVALREWRRENAIRLEEKERREKELMSQIIAEAEDYKVDFHTKRKVNCATNKVTNREREKILVSSLEKVHAEADKNYWKTIAELIPNEVPAIENKREKAGERKKPSISVIQGPKPGKPTELSRMRHILLKLKHETPSHLKISPIKDAKIGAVAATEEVAAA